MTSLIFHAVSWPVLLIALLVFGFAPGAVLRFIVLAFDRSDPRRRELLGELHNVPRIERPFWVAEQMEVALAEGLGGRLIRATAVKRKAMAVAQARTIPAAIRQEVRERCGYGCVICGSALSEYHHMLGWENVRCHRASEITLLCPNHHWSETRGELSAEMIRSANRDPMNLRAI